MTARNAAATASLVLLLGAAACTNFFEVPIETPIAPKMDVGAFQRVLIAGFISGGTDDVDANLETVRLLRSQLRSRSNLRVIEAEVLPLAELALDQARGQAVPAGDMPAGSLSATDSQPPVQAPAQSPEPQDVRIYSERDLERFNPIFADVEFWKRVGEEYQNPLIVTGTILFTPHQTSGFVTRNQEIYDNLGRREVRPVRMWMERKGFVLAPRFVFIDGRTGTVLHSEAMRDERLYPTQQNTPPLSAYFEMMDGIIPSFLGTLSMQKIRGTRILLR
ncbi:MAG: hypothetical protein H0T05_05275 [Acidobacteria bacterium]|nr:hypothetical protein [Acidobacteriota bacterium]